MVSLSVSLCLSVSVSLCLSVCITQVPLFNAVEESRVLSRNQGGCHGIQGHTHLRS
jgi:hypothetical protein